MRLEIPTLWNVQIRLGSQKTPPAANSTGLSVLITNEHSQREESRVSLCHTVTAVRTHGKSWLLKRQTSRSSLLEQLMTTDIYYFSGKIQVKVSTTLLLANTRG